MKVAVFRSLWQGHLGVFAPLFFPICFFSLGFCCASLSTLFQREDLNSALLICTCTNKYGWRLPITFKIHLPVFTLTTPVGLCSVTKMQPYFMPTFGNHGVCRALCIVLCIVLRVILHLSTLTARSPCFPLVSNTEITCENYFSCHIQWGFCIEWVKNKKPRTSSNLRTHTKLICRWRLDTVCILSFQVSCLLFRL